MNSESQGYFLSRQSQKNGSAKTGVKGKQKDDYQTQEAGACKNGVCEVAWKPAKPSLISDNQPNNPLISR